MNIIVNGEQKIFDEGISLFGIMDLLQIEDKVMAAAVNMEVIKKNDWNNYKPKDGDMIELLQFVGGG